MSKASLTSASRARMRGLAVTLAVAAVATAVPCLAETDQVRHIDASEAARVMSAGDRAFRSGRVGAATATFRTMKNLFPTWWIPSAKLVVARRQAGMKIGTVITGLEYIVDLDPTGDYLPMLLTMAAGERLSPEDVEHLGRLHEAEMAKPVPEPDFRSLRDAGDLESRYRFARAAALQAAGLHEQAEKEYRLLIQLRPFAIAPRVRLAGMLRGLGRHSDADAVLRGAEGTSLLPSRIKVLNGRSGGGHR